MQDIMLHYIISYECVEHWMGLDIALKIVIFIAVILSFYIFMVTMIFKDRSHKHLFSTWHFPMLFAILLDLFYVI